MSGRCREAAGILFKKRCALVATQTCVQCQKPTCHVHIRVISSRALCITCARTSMKDAKSRRSLAHLRDDPYFFWYYESDRWFDNDDYDDSDFDLFSASANATEGDFDAGVDDWQGT